MSALLTFQELTASPERIFRNFMSDADILAQQLEMERADVGL
jgi:hypothetical protein